MAVSAGIAVAPTSISAAPVPDEKAVQAAASFIGGEVAHQRLRAEATAPDQQRVGDFVIPVARPIKGRNGAVLAFVVDLFPGGFVVVSADDRTNPIIAYALAGQFPIQDSRHNVLLHLLTWDLDARLALLNDGGEEAKRIGTIAANRRKLLLAEKRVVKAQLASPPGARYPNDPRGWLPDPTWDQGYPYNKFCPHPTESSTSRAAVGCVATAFAQILNYWKYPSAIHFGTDDRYDSTTRGIRIDADSATQGFPSFAELNRVLATINYDGSDNENAYLSLAAGFKLRMDYAADKDLQSGAFTRSAATALKDDFGFGSAEVAYRQGSGAVWSQSRLKVIENLKKGWPVQIAIREERLGGGHSVVLEGYDESNDMFLINMGWGGSADTWYALPKFQSGGYAWEIVHTVVYDISPSQSWNQFGADANNSFRTAFDAPVEAKSKWRVECDSAFSFTGLAVGTGNNIYATVAPRFGSGRDLAAVWVIDQYGIVEKRLNLPGENERITVPAQSRQGEVFFGTDLGNVYRVDTATDQIVRIFSEPTGAQFFDPPKVDEDGRIYLTTFDKMYCLSRTGTLLWEFVPPGNANIGNGVPSIDRTRGQLYLGYFDTATRTPYLGCVSGDSGRLLFQKKFPQDLFFGSSSVTVASVGADGTVYVGSASKLYALDPDRSFAEIVTRDFSPSRLPVAPAIGFNGTLYLPYFVQIGTAFRIRFGALDPTTLRNNWEIQPASSNSPDNIFQPYAAGDGVVVFTYGNENASAVDTYEMDAYRDNGSNPSLLWHRDYSTSGGSLAFGPGNTIYSIPVSGYGQTIYAISDGVVGDPDGAGKDFLNNNQPVAPYSPSPGDGAIGVGLSATLTWDCSDPDNHSLTYDVFVGDPNVGDGDIPPFVTGLGNNAVTLTDLQPGVTYFWRVIATDGQAFTESPVWTFTTALPGGGGPNSEVRINDDFNRDGKSDIVFQDANGFLAAWFMNSSTMQSATLLSPSRVTDTFWKAFAAGDVNRDDKTDLLFQHSDGTLAVWYLDGVQLITPTLLEPSNPGDKKWKAVAAADFNGDANTDIIFQHEDGTLAIWFLKGATLSSARLIEPSNPGDSQWRLVGSGDFNSDRQFDLVFQHRDGKIGVWFMNGVQLASASLLHPSNPGEEEWRLSRVGDYDGDGDLDLLWQHQNGTLAVWRMRGIDLISGSVVNPNHPGGSWKVIGSKFP